MNKKYKQQKFSKYGKDCMQTRMILDHLLLLHKGYILELKQENSLEFYGKCRAAKYDCLSSGNIMF